MTSFVFLLACITLLHTDMDKHCVMAYTSVCSYIVLLRQHIVSLVSNPDFVLHVL